MSEADFYRVPTAAGTGSARYEDRIYEVIEVGKGGVIVYRRGGAIVYRSVAP